MEQRLAHILGAGARDGGGAQMQGEFLAITQSCQKRDGQHRPLARGDGIA